jgi:hypothetical protein
MERRIISNQEKEQRQPDDIRDLAIKELEIQRDSALEIIEQQQLIADSAQDKLEAIHAIATTPTIVVEVNYLDVEYDVYTYSERITKTEQFAIGDASITRALHSCADIIDKHSDVQLSKVGIEIAVDQQLLLLPLKDTTEWQRNFMTYLKAKQSQK